MANIPNDLEIYTNFITPEQETELVTSIKKEKWSKQLSRRTQHYGYEYQYHGKNLNAAPAIPDWGIVIIDKMIEEKIIETAPNQIIVNEYKPGKGIGPHIDSLLFDDIIISLSLASACTFRFTKSKNRNITHEIYLQPRTLIVMKGESRYKWLHDIPSVKYDDVNGIAVERKTRISLTFRYVKH